MLTRALRLFHVRFTTVYCLAVLIFSSQTRLFCTVYRQYTCIYTINMWKGRGKSDRGYFLTCERVEEDSKQEWDSCMTINMFCLFLFCIKGIHKISARYQL